MARPAVFIPGNSEAMSVPFWAAMSAITEEENRHQTGCDKDDAASLPCLPEPSR
jgi:hypothetical protein